MQMLPIQRGVIDRSMDLQNSRLHPTPVHPFHSIHVNCVRATKTLSRTSSRTYPRGSGRQHRRSDVPRFRDQLPITVHIINNLPANSRDTWYVNLNVQSLYSRTISLFPRTSKGPSERGSVGCRRAGREGPFTSQCLSRDAHAQV